MKFALENKYPIDNKEQLIKAAEFFERNIERFHPDERAIAACNIDSRSAELGVNINKGWVTNYSRMEKSAQISPDFKSSMDLRKQACIRNKVKLPPLEGVNETPSASEIIDAMVKSAEKYDTKELFEMVREFDKRACLEYLYDKQILDPHMTVFGSLNNPEFDQVKLAGDSTQYDLLRASRDMDKFASIKEKFGNEFAESFQKDPIRSLTKLGGPEKNVLSIITR